ncbi:MAG: AAA family ATPase [Rubrivivax sp.]|nr:AAA family ATPase [Rubrivivax sp.]
MPLRLRFGQFELDEANMRLLDAGLPVPMQPKVFAVLCALLRQPGQLVRKDTLLDAVWGHRHVSESVLKTTVSFVRTALGDDAAQPRYVETVHRHGYRFIGDVAADRAVPPFAAAGARQAATGGVAQAALPALVGRAEPLARLHAAWQRASAGQRQLVWIEGDPGIGKSTLIDRFAAEIGEANCARGQCVEQFGIGEPYLPLLEALESLARRRPEVVPLMRQAAPTWLVQMPWLVAEADRGALQGELAGAGAERMLREFAELLERVTRALPLLLVTEDLHWSDRGTLRLMDYLARRRGPLRLLWLGSFRLAQVIAEEHPLQRLRQELRLHRLSDEMMLEAFAESDVAKVVDSRWPGQTVPEGFVRALHRHTDGLPLFVVNVLDGLRGGPLASPGDDGAVALADAALASDADLPLPVPDSLAGAIEGQLTKLPGAAREVLQAASVCGMEFRAGLVAAVLQRDAGEVGDVCNTLVHRQLWLRDAGVATLADGTLDAKYSFRHAVYKHVFRQRLATAERIQWHRRAARALEAGRARGLPATSAEIASHHALGREYPEAVRHYTAAAEAALRRYAPPEALQLTDQALTLLHQVAEGPERLELELALTATRGTAFGVQEGVAAPPTIAAFQRVTELCDLLPPAPQRALLLNSVGWGRFTTCDYDGALALAERVRAVGEQFGDGVLSVFGCNLAGVTLANMGRFIEGRDVIRRGLEACEREAARLAEAPLYVDAQASMWANIAVPLAQLGLVDQARDMARRAAERAARVPQPMARLVGHWIVGMLGVRFDDVEAADAAARGLEDLVATTTIQQAQGPALWFRGWVEVQRGRPAEGHALVRRGYALYEEVKTYAGCTEVLSYATEALLMQSLWDEAEATLDEAQVLVDRFEERLWVTELLLQRARVAAGRGDAAGERRHVLEALAEARRAAAPGAGLKAAVALASLGDASAADRETLREAYAQVTEGLDIPVCARARALLDKGTGEQV